jgi:hypothetical protein
MNETLFTKALGNTPKIKVLEFLIEGRELDYAISDIAEGSNISRTTLFRIWDDLIRMNIIKPTRVIGNAKLFKLNQKNLFVKKMIELFDTVILNSLINEKNILMK